MTKKVHFVRIDLGEVTRSESFLFWVRYQVNRHEWECKYPACVARREKDGERWVS